MARLAVACAVAALAGCGGGGGGGGATGAAPGAVAGSGAATFGPQAAPPAAIALFNEEIQAVWNRLRPAVEAKLHQDARAQLAALVWQSGATEVSVREVRSLQLDLADAPGLTDLRTDRVAIAAPKGAGWFVRCSLYVRVEVRFGITVRHTFPITVTVRDAGAVATAELDDADPLRPLVRRVDRPVPRYRLELDSPLLFHDLLFRLLTPTARKFADDAIDGALQGMAPSLASLQGLPGPVPGDGAAPYTNSGAPTPFLDVALNIDRKIRRDHTAHGMVMRAQMDTPAPSESWLAAYGPGGTGNPGSVVRQFGYGDSAIWTSHTLASQAFRYALTGDAEALDNVRNMLEGIGRLIDLNGGTGLPARAALPISHPAGAEIDRRGAYKRTVVGSETWVTWAGDGMSRDQLSGLFFGLGIAYDRVNDPGVRAACRRRIEQMLDYLVSRRWYIDEDRPPFNAVFGNRMPTFWVGEDHQRYAWLLLGEHVSPGRYRAELARLAPLAPAVWLGRWLSAFSLEHYYKYNLDHINFYTYFRYETDPARRREMERGFAVLRRYTGRHRNPHFDAIAVAIDPGLAPALAPCIREAVRRALERNHREVAPATVSLSGIQWRTYTMMSVNGNTSSGGLRQVTIPTEPLDPRVQQLTGFFLWQRDPFTPMQPGQGDPTTECVGFGITLPYWMGRFHGIFP